MSFCVRCRWLLQARGSITVPSLRSLVPARQISTTSVRRAGSPFPPEFTSSPLFQKLAASPGLIESMSELVEILRGKGVDVEHLENTGMMQMVNLMRDTDVKEKGTQIAKQLQAADIDPREIMSMLKVIRDKQGA